MPSPPYHRRAIEEALATRTSHRVTVLEGRRAVGKSSLARHLVESGVYASYQSLTDPAAAGRAQEDAFQWVRSLRRPAVIDEAQMVPGVSVAIKELVDTLPLGHHFLLTGSASVGRGTMAGTDPLAGRATRLALHPFTGLEAQGPSDSETPSLIDILFDADLTAAGAPSTGTDDLRTRLETGGLPALALPLLPLSRAAWQNRVQADTLAILGDRVLPTEDLNTGIARRVLDSVLHTPGGQINRTRIAQELDFDPRTVGRYLGILERRFLITLLPNLHGGITRASRSAPKGHAVDTASTCESLIRAGHDIADSPELLGQTLETWVVNQFLAARGWAALTTEAFYWRDSRTGREVDLVLVDGRGRRLEACVRCVGGVGWVLDPVDGGGQGLHAPLQVGGVDRGTHQGRLPGGVVDDEDDAGVVEEVVGAGVGALGHLGQGLEGGQVVEGEGPRLQRQVGVVDLGPGQEAQRLDRGQGRQALALLEGGVVVGAGGQGEGEPAGGAVGDVLGQPLLKTRQSRQTIGPGAPCVDGVQRLSHHGSAPARQPGRGLRDGDRGTRGLGGDVCALQQDAVQRPHGASLRGRARSGAQQAGVRHLLQ